MSIGRVVGTVVVILVLYAIISQPSTSAETTRGAVGGLADAGSSMVVFLQSLTGGTSSGSTSSGGDSQVRSWPSGGVATGDGSYR